MNKEQYAKLYDIEEIKTVIIADNLVDKSDRTLLYGYTCERATWHVYMSGGEIYTVVYNHDESPLKIEIQDNMDYIPNKRLYPETCDYEFCKLLKESGVNSLPFTTWTDRPEQKKYYGKIL